VPSDPFYLNVWNATQNALNLFPQDFRNIVLGPVSRSMKKYNALCKWLPNCTVVEASVRQSVNEMMDADILVGSGSSFPLASLLHSEKPLHLSHVPKHGFNLGQDYLSRGAVWLDNTGHIDMNPVTFAFLLREHLQTHRDTHVYFDEETSLSPPTPSTVPGCS